MADGEKTVDGGLILNKITSYLCYYMSRGEAEGSIPEREVNFSAYYFTVIIWAQQLNQLGLP